MHSTLQHKLLEAVASIIANKTEFDIQFTRVLKNILTKGKYRAISSNDYALMCDHIYHTCQTIFKRLESKEIMEDDHKKVFDFIVTLVEAFPEITYLSQRNEKLRQLANDCLLRMAINAEATLKTKSRK
jgi:hypothetical protein